MDIVVMPEQPVTKVGVHRFSLIHDT